MKLRFRIISFITLFALLWGIIFSGLILFHQHQKVELKKITLLSSKSNNNELNNNLNLVRFISEKTEEKSDLNDQNNDFNKKDVKTTSCTLFQFNFWIFSNLTLYIDTVIDFTSKYYLFIEYCSLKLPF